MDSRIQAGAPLQQPPKSEELSKGTRLSNQGRKNPTKYRSYWTPCIKTALGYLVSPQLAGNRIRPRETKQHFEPRLPGMVWPQVICFLIWSESLLF